MPTLRIWRSSPVCEEFERIRCGAILPLRLDSRGRLSPHEALRLRGGCPASVKVGSVPSRTAGRQGVNQNGVTESIPEAILVLQTADNPLH